MSESDRTATVATVAAFAAPDFAALADRYLAAWNETDAARRRALIGSTWTESASYVDPLMRSDGHAGIDAMIAAVQQRFPGFRFTRVTPVDAHGGNLRFTWELAPAGAAAVVVGTDFATVAADGRLQSMTGFIDRAPEGLA
ncbi:nuclear transport factor 2 family protein [Cupriavidus basilensis]